jgi:formate C-acetyltransferase
MLKKGIYYKSSLSRSFMPKGDFKGDLYVIPEFRTQIKICLERARYLTESYKETEGEPMVIRRAKAIEHVLENMTVYIQPGELLVGNFASRPECLPTYPELVHRWLDEAIDDGHRDMLTEEEKKEYREIYRYWHGKSVDDRVRDILPDDLKDYVDFNGVCYTNHFSIWRPPESLNIRKLLKLGSNGIIDQVEQRLKDLRAGTQGLHARDYVEQRQTLEAMLIALRAVIKFAKRYADLASDLAKEEKDDGRKKELEEIASVCDWVPANRPRSLHEALQSYFFAYLIAKMIECQAQGLGDRLDQLMNPFYQLDKEAGRITREEAQELLECLYIKLSEKGHLNPPEVAGVYAGISDVKDINIGGVDEKGEDATNEFSFIILDAAESIRVPEPTIAFRYHPKIDPELVDRAIDVVRTGIGYPAFYNDSAAIPYFLNRGIPLEEARGWVILACVSPSIPGKNMRQNRPNFGVINLSSCLELALYQGVNKLTGKQLGVKTPDPNTFTRIEDVMDAYLTQVRFIGDKMTRIDNIGQAFYEQYMQRPFASALLDGCIERGKDCNSWIYHDYPNCLMTGSTNVADSLAVIKKLIFEEKKVSMSELIEAIRTNWEGKEELRQMCINDAPKFGNDLDYVDDLARQVHIRSNEEFGRTPGYWGGRPVLDGSIAGGYYAMSKGCGATPDGRKDSESTADAVMSPMAGRDKNGPTAVIKSTGKITPTYPHLFNQKFMPQFLEGENKRIFAQYLKTWADLGNWHVQFNVVDRSTLLDAQIHPEKYPDLLVRVAGYSAYFVDLSKGVQDDIIRRCEQRF